MAAVQHFSGLRLIPCRLLLIPTSAAPTLSTYGGVVARKPQIPPPLFSFSPATRIYGEARHETENPNCMRKKKSEQGWLVPPPRSKHSQVPLLFLLSPLSSLGLIACICMFVLQLALTTPRVVPCLPLHNSLFSPLVRFDRRRKWTLSDCPRAVLVPEPENR